VVFWNRRTLFRHGLYWCWMQSQGPGVPRHTALIQPPVLALAVERYAAITGDWRFVRAALPRLDAYHDWLARERDPEGDGLITIIAPWESGMDHKPSYDRALGLRYPARLRDLAIAPRLLDIANRMRNYHAHRLFAAPWRQGRFRFLVDDVLVNAVYAASLRALARLHTAVTGARAVTWRQHAERVESAIRSGLRGPDGFFYDRDARTGRLLPVRTVAGLTALLLESLTEEEAAPLLAALDDPHAFAAPFIVPSVAMDELSYCPTALRYGASPLIWRGPVWLNSNWLLVRALDRRGLDAHAERIAASSIELVRRSGFREHYNPHTGAGYGARSFGWSTLVVDFGG
jgi:glycogen debranching enzyme